MDLHASKDRHPRKGRGDGLCSSAAIMAVAAALMCGAPSSIGGQDGIRIKNISSVDSGDMPAEATGFLVRPARVPIFVDIDLGGGGAPRLPGTAVADVLTMLDANPRRLVTLRFKGGALRFDDLARGTREALLEKRGQGVVRAYNEYLANQVLALTKAIDSERPKSPLAIQGIPFEGRDSDASKGNEAYREVLDRMNAIVLGGGMMVSGASNELSMLLRAYPHAVELADGRAMLFASNGGWRIAIPGAQNDESPLAVDDSSEREDGIRADSSALASAEVEDAIGDAAVLGSPSSGDIPPDGGAGDTSSQGAGSSDGGGVGDAAPPANQGGGGGSAGGSGGGGGSGSVAGSEAEEAASSNVDSEASNPDQQSSGDPNGSEIDQPNAGGDDASSSDGDVEGDESGSSESDDSGAADEPEWDPEDEVDEPDDGSDDQVDSGDEESEGSDPGDDSGGDGSENDDSSGEDSSDDEADGGGDDSSADHDGDEANDGSENPIPLLIPGDGFDRETTCPPQQGDPLALGHDHEPVTAWSSPPWAQFDTGDFVGLVAFHSSGIEKVEISIDDGPWSRLDAPTRNPSTGVVEYCGEIAEAVRDNALIRSIVYPKSGKPVVMELPIAGAAAGAGREAHVSPAGDDLLGDGTPARPFRTISRAAYSLSVSSVGMDASHTTIRLAAGEYDLGLVSSSHVVSTETGWLTIRPEEGVASDDCIISSSSTAGLRVTRLALAGLDITASLSNSSSQDDYLWLDGCRLLGSGPGGITFWASSWWTGVFCTDTAAIDVVNGFTCAKLVRNCTADTVYNDAFPGVQCVINSEVRNQVGGTNPSTGYVYHSDIWQERAGFTDENVIVYGIVAVDNCLHQGLFTRTGGHDGIAFVNNLLNLTGYPEQSQIRTRCQHLVFENNTLLGAPIQVGISDSHPDVSGYYGTTAASWKNNVLQWLVFFDPEGLVDNPVAHYSQASSGSVFLDNHFVNQWPDYTGQSGVPYGAVTVGAGISTGHDIPEGRGSDRP